MHFNLFRTIGWIRAGEGWQVIRAQRYYLFQQRASRSQLLFARRKTFPYVPIDFAGARMCIDIHEIVCQGEFGLCHFTPIEVLGSIGDSYCALEV